MIVHSVLMLAAAVLLLGLAAAIYEKVQKQFNSGF